MQRPAEISYSGIVTRMSAWPNAFCIRPASASTDVRSETSQLTASHRAPPARICSAARSSVSCDRPHITVVAPNSAKRVEIAYPIPRPPPVITATLSLRAGSFFIPSDPASEARFSGSVPHTMHPAARKPASNQEGKSIRASNLPSTRYILIIPPLSTLLFRSVFWAGDSKNLPLPGPGARSHMRASSAYRQRTRTDVANFPKGTE